MPTDDPSDARLHFPAAERNRGPILSVLERVLPPEGTLLEVASGSGQHAVFFAEHLPGWTIQPSDPDIERRASITAWIAHAKLPNVRPPLRLDVTETPWPIEAADAIVCSNMIHIAPFEACLALFDGAARLLAPGAPLFTYGPYRVGGVHTTESNAAFDEVLRERNAAWGVRDTDDLTREARARGLRLEERVPMPANNFTLVFRRK